MGLTARTTEHPTASSRQNHSKHRRAQHVCLALAAVALLACMGCADGTSSGASQTQTSAAHNEWTWVGGAQTVNQPESYGTKGTASAANIPGARTGGVSWTDASGNFWLFGGTSEYHLPSPEYLNDLWEYSNGQWVWMSGSIGYNQEGVYGTLGVAAAGNTPGARQYALAWTDKAGNFWLFGGIGFDAQGTLGEMNDLWRYSPGAGQWTWVGGASSANTYSGLSWPVCRERSVGWTDTAGNFWLYGGASEANLISDLWTFSPVTGQWTEKGQGVGLPYPPANQTPIYGTQGVASGSSFPGAREWSNNWTDTSGTLWLFGGIGYDSTGASGSLNDLWKYSAGQWTWVSGSNLANQNGVYGTQGVAASANTPAPRAEAATWTDASGNLWLFGGAQPGTDLNDLWKYGGGEWTWVGGSQLSGQPGIYGAQGTPSSSNIPGARFGSATWTDGNGYLWLFGGGANLTAFNDLWKYQP